ncbi:MAG: molybdopterin-synthase adenylyltransferase MoeB [Chthoniobacterales bacterium]|nr:molybdopterin-synthase adenylyltransferase MoeB [Chthoniobacterales bacterium]
MERMFSHDELQRYARQMAMPEFGLAGQEKLRAARVLMIGAGGLGSPAALYLAAAGVGTIGLVDPDEVESSNLHRQILHGSADAGRAKVDSARDTLAGINPHVRLEIFRARFDAANAVALARGWDVVVDGSDNFPTRYASNDACVSLGIPNVYGSVWRFEGQVSVFAPHLGGPCYRCLNPRAPAPGTVPGCAEAGVLGVVPGLIGTLQALEAIKLLAGIGGPLVGRLLHVDALAMKFREFVLRRDPHCARCADGRRDLPVEVEGEFCQALAVMKGDEISVSELAALRESGKAHVLLDVREPWELATARLDPCLHIPMGEVAARVAEIPRDLPVCVLCHAGVRGARVTEFLQGQGMKAVANVRGGIAAWSAEVDASVPAY